MIIIIKASSTLKTNFSGATTVLRVQTNFRITVLHTPYNMSGIKNSEIHRKRCDKNERGVHQTFRTTAPHSTTTPVC